jgi:acetolactate synthase-like protein
MRVIPSTTYLTRYTTENIYMDGGTRVAEIFRLQGVTTVFTLCGGHIAPILVACETAGIRVVDVRHEANAAFAADAYARLTGIPGVALVTAGPGVTNALTAVKNAQLAQSPMVLIGGATATMLRGRGALQDIDQMALVAPHVKWAARPNRLGDVGPAVEKAFRIAKEGVPGPVFVELAVDLLYDETTVRDWYKAKTDKPNQTLVERAMSLYIKGHLTYLFGLPEQSLPSLSKPGISIAEVPGLKRFTNATNPEPPPFEIHRAGLMLSKAERPVIVLGSQAMLHPARVQDLVEAVGSLHIPVYLSGMARGLLGAQHRLQVRHKRREALREADVVLLAGVPCDFRLDYGSHVSRARVISVNLSGEDLYKNRSPEVAILADPHLSLVALAKDMESKSAHEEWLSKLKGRDENREQEIEKMSTEKSDKTNPVNACRAIERHLSDGSILIGDGGDFVATASYVVRPRGPLSWLDPGVFGTLGVGAGFAIASKVCHPESDVWIFYGDGAAGFSISEFDTFVRHKLPVIAVVGNDAGWTQIAREQVAILGRDTATVLAYTDYHKVAEGWGAKGILVKDDSELESALTQAVALSRQGFPVLVNILLGKTDFRKGSISI